MGRGTMLGTLLSILTAEKMGIQLKPANPEAAKPVAKQ